MQAAACMCTASQADARAPTARAGHVAALRKLEAHPDLGCVAYNLGTGTGTTVLEMVHVSFYFISGGPLQAAVHGSVLCCRLKSGSLVLAVGQAPWANCGAGQVSVSRSCGMRADMASHKCSWKTLWGLPCARASQGKLSRL